MLSQRAPAFHSLEHEKPARLDFYKAKAVDGMGHVIHERLFAVEVRDEDPPQLQGPDLLGNLIPGAVPDVLPAVTSRPEATDWLNRNALRSFIDEVSAERLAEVNRIEEHVNLSLTEVLHRIDQEIGRAAEEVSKEIIGAEGRLAQAETRHAEVLARRERRQEELKSAACGDVAGSGADDKRAHPAAPRTRDPGCATPASQPGNRDDCHAGRHGT